MAYRGVKAHKGARIGLQGLQELDFFLGHWLGHRANRWSSSKAGARRGSGRLWPGAQWRYALHASNVLQQRVLGAQRAVGSLESLQLLLVHVTLRGSKRPSWHTKASQQHECDHVQRR